MLIPWNLTELPGTIGIVSRILTPNPFGLHQEHLMQQSLVAVVVVKQWLLYPCGCN